MGANTTDHQSTAPTPPVGEASLGRSELLATILDGVADGISAQDSSGRLVFANSAAAQAGGYPSAAEMLAAPPGDYLARFDLFDDAGAAFPIDRLPGRRALRGELQPEEVIRFRSRATGEERWSLVKARPVFDEQGRIVLAINIFRDITASRLTGTRQRLLAEAGRALAGSLDPESALASVARIALPEFASFCVVDLSDADGAVRRVAGVHVDRDREHLLAVRPVTGSSAHDAAGARASRVLLTGETVYVPDFSDMARVAEMLDPELQELAHNVSARSLISAPLLARGRILGAITFGLTEGARRFDRADVDLAEELGRRSAVVVQNARLVADAERSQREAVEANQAKTSFLAVMSHELRTPLNAIAGYTELLDMGVHGPLTDAQRTDLQRLKRSQQHLLGLIDHVLEFARIEAGRLELDIQTLATAEMLAGITVLFKPQITVKELTLRLDGSTPPPRVRADPEKLRQILINITSNAIKFTPPGGSIMIACSAEQDWARISVSDTGEGIPEAHLERIFEPFVQADAAPTRRHPGTGLGLAISRQLARAMGGEITVSSKLGQGSTFTLALPVGDRPSPQLSGS